MRSALVAGVAILLAVGAGSCGDPSPPRPVPKPPAPARDRIGEILADTTIDDVEAVRRAVVCAAFMGRDGDYGDRLVVRGDADGAPEVHLRWPFVASGDYVKGQSTRVSSKEEGPWTVAKEREHDMMTLGLGVRYEDIVRVGVARRLRFIETTVMKAVMVDGKDEPVEVFRFRIPREKIENFPKEPKWLVMKGRFDRIGEVVFDRYDQLTVEPVRR